MQNNFGSSCCCITLLFAWSIVCQIGWIRPRQTMVGICTTSVQNTWYSGKFLACRTSNRLNIFILSREFLVYSIPSHADSPWSKLRQRRLFSLYQKILTLAYHVNQGKILLSGADPGFPVRWAPNLQGAPTYDFVQFSKICMKLRIVLAVGGPLYIRRVGAPSYEESCVRPCEQH